MVHLEEKLFRESENKKSDSRNKGFFGKTALMEGNPQKNLLLDRNNSII